MGLFVRGCTGGGDAGEMNPTSSASAPALVVALRLSGRVIWRIKRRSEYYRNWRIRPV